MKDTEDKKAIDSITKPPLHVLWSNDQRKNEKFWSNDMTFCSSSSRRRQLDRQPLDSLQLGRRVGLSDARPARRLPVVLWYCGPGVSTRLHKMCRLGRSGQRTCADKDVLRLAVAAPAPGMIVLLVLLGAGVGAGAPQSVQIMQERAKGVCR
jgi:hypothetical protein